jgi:hypothetical protein
MEMMMMNEMNTASGAKPTKKLTHSKATAFRFTPEEHAHLGQLAEASGLSRAEVLRKLVRSTPLPTRLPAFDQAALGLLSRVGNNLNQIARSVNNGDRTLVAFEAMVKEADQVRAVVNEALQKLRGF